MKVAQDEVKRAAMWKSAKEGASDVGPRYMYRRRDGTKYEVPI